MDCSLKSDNARRSPHFNGLGFDLSIAQERGGDRGLRICRQIVGLDSDGVVDTCDTTE